MSEEKRSLCLQSQLMYGKDIMGRTLPVDDAHVGDEQVCTGTMDLQTVGRQQPVENWTYAE